MLIAVTREVSPAIGRCELTHLSRTSIDLQLAKDQHSAYERRLAEAGCSVQRLPADASMPDSVFIEDTAVVFDQFAVIARPGAASRRVETPAVVEALQRYRRLRRIEAPGTVDGGDVLVAGRSVFVGRSNRTNEAGIDQLREVLGEYGYSTTVVTVTGCLHLKSAVTCIGEQLLLMNPAWTAASDFVGFSRIDVDPSEPFAANALRVRDFVIVSTACPRTRDRLERHGLRVREVDMSETAKAEGGVTCCSVIFGS